MRLFFIIFVFIFTFINPNFGQNIYYVDASTGNDANNGLSPASAWQTIDKINNQTFSPGDQILFKRNETWTGEQLEVTDYSGTDTQPITFGAYPTSGAKPTITVITNQSTSWVDQGNNIWKASTPPIYHPDRLWVDDTESLRANNSNELGMAIFFWYYDSPENGNLYLKSTTDPALKQISFTNNRIPLYLENTSYIDFENLNLQGGWTSIYINTNTNYINIKESSIGKFAGNGIDINSENASLPSYLHISDCTFDSDFTLDYSSAPAYTGSDDRGAADGIFLQSADHCEIDNCSFKNWGHASINVDGNPNGGASVRATYISVHDNYMTSPDICYGGRIAVDDAQFCDIYNNQIVNTSVQTQFAGRNNHYHHNLIIGTTNPPIIPNGQEISAGISVESYSNTEVKDNIFENNLIINTEGAGFRFTNSGNYDIHNNIIRNNSIINCGNTAENGISLNIQPNTSDCIMYSNDFKNNLIFNSNTTTTIDFRGTTYSVAGFNTLNGSSNFDISNNISMNPLLVDQANGDYHLTQNSPCINTGTSTLATKDFDGNPIPVNSVPDIGPFEYQTILPINVIDPFTARLQENSIKLTWLTDAEVNNDYYILSKSRDLETWSSITTIAPNASKNYSYVDRSPFQGISYYRLTQKDLDEKINLIGIVSTYFRKVQEPTIFPNPSQNQLTILFNKEYNFKNIKISIFNNLGQLIFEKNDNNQLDISSLKKGSYVVSIQHFDKIWYKSLIKH